MPPGAIEFPPEGAMIYNTISGGTARLDTFVNLFGSCTLCCRQNTKSEFLDNCAIRLLTK